MSFSDEFHVYDDPADGQSAPRQVVFEDESEGVVLKQTEEVPAPVLEPEIDVTEEVAAAVSEMAEEGVTIVEDEGDEFGLTP